MAKINEHSPEWKAVLAFIAEEGSSAVDNLIADNKSEQQRGAIQILDKLSKLADPEMEPIKPDHYDT